MGYLVGFRHIVIKHLSSRTLVYLEAKQHLHCYCNFTESIIETAVVNLYLTLRYANFPPPLACVVCDLACVVCDLACVVCDYEGHGGWVLGVLTSCMAT